MKPNSIHRRPERVRRPVMTFLFTLLVLTIPPLSLLPIFPAFYLFDKLDAWMGIADSNHIYYLAAIPLFAWPTAFVLCW